MSVGVREERVAVMKMELADLDKRLGNARSAVELGQKEVDLLAAQHSELYALIRELEQRKELPA